MKNFNEVILNKDYDFLRTEEVLKDNIIMLGLGGSHAYGTNVEGSDVDIRGITLTPAANLLGFGNFEQFEDKKTDTVIYSFNKAVSLFLDCNPNTIEMLGLKPEHYLTLKPAGKLLVDNRHLFLSQKAALSFSGYADGQLRRLQNALAHDSYEEQEKARHIANALKSAMNSFKDRYSKFDKGQINLFVDEENEICADFMLKGYPLRQVNGMMNEMLSIIRNYDKLNNRNKKKDDFHLCKHAMHLVRLYVMGIDIFEKEEIVTYRENEHDLFMDIRNGKYQKPDGSFSDEFFDILNMYKKRMEYAAKKSSLPEKPDYKKVEELVMEVNKKTILRYDIIE